MKSRAASTPAISSPTPSEQCVLQRVDGGVDQVGAVVDRNDLEQFWEAGGDLLKALLDVLYDVERVDAETLQHDAAGEQVRPSMRPDHPRDGISGLSNGRAI